jgi:hypothetical protein
MRRELAAAVLLSLFVSAPTVHALTDQDRWAAHQQLTQAQELKKKGELPEALTHYEESLKLDPTKLQTMTELAELEEQLGKLEQARVHWAMARDKAGQAGAAVTKKRAEERLAALEQSTAHLTLQLAPDTPADAQILLDGAALERATLGTALAANPGDHVVTVKAPGRDDATFPVKLAPGDNQTLSVGPAPKAAPPPPPPPPPSPIVAQKPPADEGVSLSTESGHTRRTLGIVAGSVGLVGIGAGAVFWSVGWRDRGHLGPDSDRNITIGQIGVVSGVVLLAAGVVLYVTAPSGDAKTARLSVVPTLDIAADRTVLGAAGRF